MLTTKTLNIVVPMAGQGSRFQTAGYKDPKPLIPVMNQPMIKLVIENLRPKNIPYRFIFICRQEMIQQYRLDKLLSDWAPGCEILTCDKLTEGAACTVLLAEKFIDNEQPLMIANCDQLVDVSMDEYLNTMQTKNLDGLIMTMTANDPKWSFVRMNTSGKITEVVEKKVVSDEATVGIYNYRTGRTFVNAAKQMIAKNLRVNNEFYVAPAYNEMINDGANIGIYNIGSEFKGMYGLGVPGDLEKFVEMKPRLTYLG